MDLKFWWFLICLIPWIETTWTPSLAARWQVEDPKNFGETCLLFTGDFVLTIPYVMDNGEIGNASVAVPKSAKSNGTCDEQYQEISISWPVPSEATDSSSVSMDHVVTFRFKRNGTRKNETRLSDFYQLVEMRAEIHSNQIEFPLDANPDQIVKLVATPLHLWITPLDLSYFCDTDQEVLLNLPGATLRMSHVQVQPFHETPIGGERSEFSIRFYCRPDVHSMMTNGLLFIALLFLVSIGIGYTLQRSRKSVYRPL